MGSGISGLKYSGTAHNGGSISVKWNKLPVKNYDVEVKKFRGKECITFHSFRTKETFFDTMCNGDTMMIKVKPSKIDTWCNPLKIYITS